MHILKMVFKNVPPFENILEIDFTNSDSVRRSLDDNEFDMKVFKIKPGIYTHVLMALTGLNATGKTTALELMSMASQIIIDGEKLNEQSIRRFLMKIYPHFSKKKDDLLSWDIYFIHENKVYKLHSVINKNNEDRNEFFYEEEVLWGKSLKSVTYDKLFDFSDNQIKTNRSKEKDNPYFKNDMSIVASLGNFSETLRPIGVDTMINFPFWRGKPTQEALHLFDPNISDLSIEKKENGNLECHLNFTNQSQIEYGGSPMLLNSMLSAGTIRGLSIMPAIIQVLGRGGYVFIDELENNFNKKIIEWFLELFTDKRTNPHGACLIFTTHYPELLDTFSRKDNIFITRRDKNNYCECVKYSTFVKRNELSKGRVILENVIRGTAPRYKDLLAAHDWVANTVKEMNQD